MKNETNAGNSGPDVLTSFSCASRVSYTMRSVKAARTAKLAPKLKVNRKVVDDREAVLAGYALIKAKEQLGMKLDTANVDRAHISKWIPLCRPATLNTHRHVSTVWMAKSLFVCERGSARHTNTASAPKAVATSNRESCVTLA